ncbi:MAG: DUF3418 domain-containing protein, partial [Casimicrobiaceae bacterium]
RSGITQWDFGTLPATLSIVRGGARLTGYPALCDDSTSVSLKLLDTEDAAVASTRRAVVRLIGLALKDVLQRLGRATPAFNAAALQLRAAIAPDALLADALAAVAERAFIGDDPLPRDAAAYGEQVKRARTRLPAVAEHAMRLLGEIAAAHQSLSAPLAALATSRPRLAAEIRTQREALVYPGFFAATPWPHATQIPRYLAALARRMSKLAERGERDTRQGEQVAAWWQRYAERRDALGNAGGDAALAEFRWLLEELRVSLFAQELKTPYPVSFKRVERAWTALAGR